MLQRWMSLQALCVCVCVSVPARLDGEARTRAGGRDMCARMLDVHACGPGTACQRYSVKVLAANGSIMVGFTSAAAAFNLNGCRFFFS